MFGREGGLEQLERLMASSYNIVVWYRYVLGPPDIAALYLEATAGSMEESLDRGETSDKMQMANSTVDRGAEILESPKSRSGKESMECSKSPVRNPHAWSVKQSISDDDLKPERTLHSPMVSRGVISDVRVSTDFQWRMRVGTMLHMRGWHWCSCWQNFMLDQNPPSLYGHIGVSTSRRMG